MSKRMVAILAGLLVLLAVAVGTAGAEEAKGTVRAPLLATTGTAFTYQGYLEDLGSPANSAYDLEFKLFDATSGGGQSGSTLLKDDVSVSGGYFMVELDFGSVFDGTAFWLEIGVRPGASTGSFTLLTPRQPLSAVPYAITALNLPVHDHFGESWSGTGTGLSLASTDSTGVVNGLWAETASDAGNGIYGYATSTTGPAWGVVGESDADEGIGVFGNANSPSGTTYGVLGQTASTTDNAIGVYGYASAVSGNTRGVLGVSESNVGEGVFGVATSTTGSTSGVYGRSDSVDGSGVTGWVSSMSGETYGVIGFADSSSDFSSGVWGSQSATSGFTSGVYGDSASSSGTGVVGYNYASSGDTVGVMGQANSPDGVGVWGYAPSSSGVPIGVLGEAPANGWGVYASGDMGASGTKSAVVETQDYGWRILYALESPEVWFEDFGTGHLIDGIATIDFEPIYAQTVNFSIEYHVFLTPLGDCQMYVSDKGSASFSVKAMGGQTCSVDFDYRIVAKRLGYENERLASESLLNSDQIAADSFGASRIRERTFIEESFELPYEK